VFLMGALPWIDAGLAVIFFTIIIKLLLFPLSQKATRTQIQMKALEPELEKIKAKYKDNQQEQGKAIMKFYSDNKLNPFSGILLLFIQLPILISLYYAISNGLPVIKSDILYSFVSVPVVNMHFLGLIDISLSKNLLLAFFVGLTQYFQVRYSIPKAKPRAKEDTFKDELARSMSVQMRYVMPGFMALIAYGFPGAVALYFITSNIFAVFQEMYIRKNVGKNN
jgi:YidC/Oxa1 family membrane protein insertase